MSNGLDKTHELLDQLLSSKQNLVDILESKGEEASTEESFVDLIERAANYIPKSYMFIDADGNEVPGVLVDQVTVFDAVENDVREGKTYAGETGVKTGTKEIPAYQTQEGNAIIRPGKTIKLVSKNYNYTKLQALVCLFNTSIDDSVATDKVAIDSNVYSVKSNVPISIIEKISDTNTIDFGITNDTEQSLVLRFIHYKEEY